MSKPLDQVTNTKVDDPLNILIKKESAMENEPTKIEVEDFGASIANEIIAISTAMKNTKLTDRAIAVLVRDRTTLRLGDIVAVIEYLRTLEKNYVKHDR